MPPKKRRLTAACEYCRKKKVKCNGEMPCINCTDPSKCIYTSQKKRGPRKKLRTDLHNNLKGNFFELFMSTLNCTIGDFVSSDPSAVEFHAAITLVLRSLDNGKSKIVEEAYKRCKSVAGNNLDVFSTSNARGFLLIAYYFIGVDDRKSAHYARIAHSMATTTEFISHNLERTEAGQLSKIVKMAEVLISYGAQRANGSNEVTSRDPSGADGSSGEDKWFPQQSQLMFLPPNIQVQQVSMKAKTELNNALGGDPRHYILNSANNRFSLDLPKKDAAAKLVSAFQFCVDTVLAHPLSFGNWIREAALRSLLAFSMHGAGLHEEAHINCCRVLDIVTNPSHLSQLRFMPAWAAGSLFCIVQIWLLTDREDLLPSIISTIVHIRSQFQSVQRCLEDLAAILRHRLETEERHEKGGELRVLIELVERDDIELGSIEDLCKGWADDFVKLQENSLLESEVDNVIPITAMMTEGSKASSRNMQASESEGAARPVDTISMRTTANDIPGPTPTKMTADQPEHRAEYLGVSQAQALLSPIGQPLSGILRQKEAISQEVQMLQDIQQTLKRLVEPSANYLGGSDPVGTSLVNNRQFSRAAQNHQLRPHRQTAGGSQDVLNLDGHTFGGAGLHNNLGLDRIQRIQAELIEALTEKEAENAVRSSFASNQNQHKGSILNWAGYQHGQQQQFNGVGFNSNSMPTTEALMSSNDAGANTMIDNSTNSDRVHGGRKFSVGQERSKEPNDNKGSNLGAEPPATRALSVDQQEQYLMPNLTQQQEGLLLSELSRLYERFYQQRDLTSLLLGQRDKP